MMRVKKYVAPSLADAVTLARSEMGREAVIVDSRKVRASGLYGLFGGKLMEVTVAVEEKPAGPSAPRPVVRPSASPAGAAQAVAQPAVFPTLPVPGAGAEPATHLLTKLEHQMEGLRSAVTRLYDMSTQGKDAAALSGFARTTLDRLEEVGVLEEIAVEICRRLPSDQRKGKEVLRQEIRRLLGEPAPITVTPGKRRVIALVGPTGVGKTTTLAKLAARFAFGKGCKVSLITADTFRIAAIQQLRTYAEILGVSLYTADTPAQIGEALRETASSDLVLVDTGGHSHRDTQRTQEMQELLAVLRPDEAHLVFSLTTNPRDALQALEYYRSLGVNRVIYTKLDESTSPGLMLNVRVRCDLPISYLTNGQAVPDDIMPADEADLTQILIGG